jgi:hypothetical protein
MKMKVNDVLVYKDAQQALRHGMGVVTGVTYEEYTILWSGRGVTKYRRSILDAKWAQLFRLLDVEGGLPRARHMKLGASESGVSFNENYDRAKVAALCEKLRASGLERAEEVADGLAEKLFTKRFTLSGRAKVMLGQLAELCAGRGSAANEEAREISKELFFGYVLQGSDFQVLKPGK